MNTDKEFVPYQPSLDMKELGFDEPCFGRYNPDNDLIVSHTETYNNDRYRTDFRKTLFTQAPTFSQCFRWIREKHNLMFQIFYLRNGNHAVIIHRTTPEYMDLVDQVRSSSCVDEVVDCYSYEEAELECLIKLIEIVKNK